MCILSYIPKDVALDDSHAESLWNGGVSNPDGHGWAIASGDQMFMGKSLELDEALSDFIDARENHPGDAIFHSRWATHGSVKVGNCHPFLVGGSHRTVLAHNGILPKDAHPGQGDDRSDTAILAEDILPRRWFRLDRPTVRRSMTEWAGKGNKVVILTVDPRYRENAYLINGGMGNWDEGVWHSNHDYLPYPKYRYAAWDSPVIVGAKKPLALEAGEWEYVNEDLCFFCPEREGHVNTDNVCTTCGYCQDCFEVADECQCYVSTRVRA